MGVSRANCAFWNCRAATQVTSPRGRPCPQVTSPRTLLLWGPHLLTSPDSADSDIPGSAAPSSAEEVWVAEEFVPPAEVRSLTAEEKWPGEWHLIAIMVAHGYSQRAIAKELDYTEGRISLILSKPAVQDKIERIRQEESGNVGKRFAGIAPRALDFFERVVDGKEAARTGERLQASQWILEKATGKPKSDDAKDGGASVLQVLEALQKMRDLVRPDGEGRSPELGHSTIDVSPARDPLADWISTNLSPEEQR